MTRPPYFRLVALAFLTLILSPVVQAAPLSLAQLMTNLAKNPQGAATFTEKKFISILEQPIEPKSTATPLCRQDQQRLAKDKKCSKES